MSKVYDAFYVDKTARTFADNLLAFGWARVVDELLALQSGSGSDVVIVDCGAYYRLDCTPALEVHEDWHLANPVYFARPIRTAKNADTIPPDMAYHDYDEHRETVNFFFAALKKGAASEDLEFPEFWEIERAINPLTLPGYNSLMIDWWNLREHQSTALDLLLELYSRIPNDYLAAIDTWKELDRGHGWDIKAEATCQQLFNPDQGKGQNKAKADGLSIGNVTSFWLAEWLKAIGFFEIALTRTVRGGKDRKTFVIAPRKLSSAINRKVMSEFLSSMTTETSTKFDILAVIRYTEALLKHIQTENSLLEQMFGSRSLRDELVAGFDTAFYKDLGNATATMNVSFIALPGWVTVQSRDDISLYTDSERGLLTQMAYLTRQFDERHSDAFTLLQHLRDFISADDLTAFFRFSNAFAGYYIGKRERNQYAFRLTTEFIERLVMSTEPRLSPILESAGFQNIAYAIRQSTVTAQYRKKQGDRKYDVRYGLGQELARKSRYPETFIAALSDFLHKYNAENAQVMETRQGPYRRSIKTSDIDEVVWLIDQYGSETVANLLIAYGYARVARDDESEPEMITEENEA